MGWRRLGPTRGPGPWFPFSGPALCCVQGAPLLLDTEPRVSLQLFPRDLACISTLLTFEYVSQLCQNKDWACPVSDARATEGGLGLGSGPAWWVGWICEHLSLLAAG